jgi:hypothetical protein
VLVSSELYDVEGRVAGVTELGISHPPALERQQATPHLAGGWLPQLRHVAVIPGIQATALTAPLQSSKSRFALVTDRQQSHLFPVQMIQNDIACASEADRPFPELWVHIFQRAADVGMAGQDLDAGTDRPDSAAGGVAIFRC